MEENITPPLLDRQHKAKQRSLQRLLFFEGRDNGLNSQDRTTIRTGLGDYSHSRSSLSDHSQSQQQAETRSDADPSVSFHDGIRRPGKNGRGKDSYESRLRNETKLDADTGFFRDGLRRIDFVLAYVVDDDLEVESKRRYKRREFELNLEARGPSNANTEYPLEVCLESFLHLIRR